LSAKCGSQGYSELIAKPAYGFAILFLNRVSEWRWKKITQPFSIDIHLQINNIAFRRSNITHRDFPFAQNLPEGAGTQFKGE
jgi:hypothetical protein